MRKVGWKGRRAGDLQIFKAKSSRREFISPSREGKIIRGSCFRLTCGCFVATLFSSTPRSTIQAESPIFVHAGWNRAADLGLEQGLRDGTLTATCCCPLVRGSARAGALGCGPYVRRSCLLGLPVGCGRSGGGKMETRSISVTWLRRSQTIPSAELSRWSSGKGPPRGEATRHGNSLSLCRGNVPEESKRQGILLPPCPESPASHAAAAAPCCVVGL